MLETLIENDLSDSFYLKLKRCFLMIYFSIPLMISNIAGNSFWFINAYYAGHMQNIAELAAMGIANSWICFVGIGPMISCNYGFFALAAHVNGTGNEKNLKIVCQRGLIFNLILFLFSCFLLLISPILLSFLGVEDHIIRTLTPYTYCYIFCLFTEIFVDMLRNLLNAQKIFNLYPVTSLIGTFIHFIQCGIFTKFGYGLLSLAISKFLTNIYTLIIICGFMKYKKMNGFLIESFESSSKSHLLDYSKNIIPSGIITYVQWMAFEFTTIMASNFNDVVLSAHAVFLSILGLNYCLFTGAGVLYSSHLANSLGKKDVNAAIILKGNFNVLIIILAILYVIYIKITFQPMITLLTDKIEVYEELSKIIILSYTLCCFDFYGGTLANTLRAVGQQKYAAGLFILAYYTIGIPLGIILGVVLKFTLLGWFGSMYLSQVVFCYLGHRKFNQLNMEEVIKEVEMTIDYQFSEVE